jgi:hypothetical protein
MEPSAEMHRNRKAVAPPRKGGPGGTKGERAHGRSRLSNLVGRLPDVDKRSAVGRRFFDIVSALTVDAGARIDAAGGCDLPEAKRQLIRRFAGASVIAEMLEARLASGQDISIRDHAQLCSVLVRISQRIGIDRTPKQILDDIDDPAFRVYEEALQRADDESESDDIEAQAESDTS